MREKTLFSQQARSKGVIIRALFELRDRPVRRFELPFELAEEGNFL